MKVSLKRIDKDFHLEATNEQGNTLHTDASPVIGGHNQGMRPMELMLVSVGSCSSIDVIQFLRKQRQELDDIQVEVTAEREKDAVPSLFTKIHVHYSLFGEVSKKKAERAISLSMEKYCSAVKMLEKTAKVSWDYQINP
ncbi:MAG: OsmC family protein [Bacteroidetes bacterium]|nr:OsmC family protein [Bacteroidota bacterium]